MSLPPYEPSKDDQAYPDDIKSPTGPGDVKGSDLPAYKHEVGFLEGSDFIQREFIFCNLQWSTDVLVFPSSDAATKYKSFKNVPADSDNFRYVLDLQQNGIGMPLMEAVFSWIHSFGNGKFATIYKCLPPPPNSGRIFDKKRDRYKFCTVRKKAGTHYSQYIFSILPKPDKPSEIIEFSIFFHNKLPIADVTKYGGSNKRYRWVHSDSHSLSMNFTYSLYSLDDHQTSMIDNMDANKQKLDKKNPLVYSSVAQFFKFESKKVKEEYLSLVKMGELIHFKDKITALSFQETSKLVLHIERTSESPDLENINSVGLYELINICMSLVLKRRQENKIETDRAAVSSAAA
ncbi:unnamed protein product [Debaryomyces fabryi]|nr:unnamed protein product [Debaryomyces fabryi]